LIRNYHYCLRNNPEERSSDLLRGGSLKASTKPFLFVLFVARVNDSKNCFFGFATLSQYPPGVAVTRYNISLRNKKKKLLRAEVTETFGFASLLSSYIVEITLPVTAELVCQLQSFACLRAGIIRHPVLAKYALTAHVINNEASYA